MAYYKKSKPYHGTDKQKRDFLFLCIIILLCVSYYLYRLAQTNPLFFVVFLVLFGGSIFFGIIIFKKWSERKYKKIKQIQDMQNMRRRDFELFIEYVFRKNGYKAKVRSGQADGGVDVDAKKGDEKIIVQCKKWSYEKVGVEKLREFYGVVSMTPGARGIFVTTSEFTDPAKKEYEKMKDKIEIWDKYNLEGFVADFTSPKK